MRQVVLDTETTGLSPEEGHRVIEIGCIELINRKVTDNRFHVYLNPDREIDRGAIEVHGIDDAFLSDKPRFGDVVEDFVAYVRGAELIIHNAPFDVGFLDHEFQLARKNHKISEICMVLDTLVVARKKHPGQRNSLDALCKRYGIDNSHRELHGALLDAEILADVYLEMTGGQTSIIVEDQADNEGIDQSAIRRLSKDRPRIRVIQSNSAELEAHKQYIQFIASESGGQCLWLVDTEQ